MHTIKLAGITNVAIDTRSCPRYALVRRIRVHHTTCVVLLVKYADRPGCAQTLFSAPLPFQNQ